MLTMKDIAKEAGVSVMMVSRVINKRYDLVSDKNIEKIEKIIKKYNFVPNSSAQSLSSKSSKIRAVFMQGDASSLSNQYNSIMLGNIIERVQSYGYNTMVHFVSEYSEIIDNLKAWKASGAIFFGSFVENINKLKENITIPLIFTDSYSPTKKVTNIGIDDYKGGALAANYFIKHGHKNLAYVGEYINDSLLVKERFKGFSETLLSAGIPLIESHIINFTSIENTVNELISIKDNHLGIFAFSDILALKIINELSNKGFSVPNDFSIIGFDNLEISSFSQPGLTTIKQDIVLKAITSVDLLFKYIKSPDMSPQNIVLDVELIERNSVKKLL